MLSRSESGRFPASIRSHFSSGIAVAPEVQLTAVSIGKHLMSAAEHLEELRQRLGAIVQEAGGE